ncbi:hypothetical protein ACIQXI_04990 [Lysinibacillus sp. NPDC097195]|uniref:hypothetical protein n=1 Tax=Lysinibacillus sp. NPDC097195 TaxID=3364141 RepID=UPI0037F9E4A7
MDIRYDSSYIYIENIKDEAMILNKFCKDKGNKLVFLELYSEEDVAALFINNYRFKILDNAVVYKEQENKISILHSSATTMDIRKTLKLFPWDFSAIVLQKNTPIRIKYHIRGYESDNGVGIRIKEFKNGSFIKEILPLLTQTK